MPAKLLLSLALAWVLASPWAGAEAVEREVEFAVDPAEAQVLIQNDLGSWDHYPANRRVRVVFPFPAFNLRVEAPGWKSQDIPLNLNQFTKRYPLTGHLELAPDSIGASLRRWPRWPWALVGLGTVLVGRKRRLAASKEEPPPPGEPPPSGLPWELSQGTLLQDSTGDRPGFRILERLGEGVTSVVYRAQGPDGEVALKLLKPQQFRDGQAQARFRREMTSLCRLRHPNIPILYEFGESQGMGYLVMELLSDQTLSQRLQAGPLEETAAVDLLRTLTGALAFCHAQQVLHRDLKPDNVLFGLDGRPRLSDFGLARPHDASTLTVEGTMLGTPAYMAPEVAQGQPGDERSDLYSLGCLAYHLLAGQPPFTGDNPLAIVVQQISSPPPPLSGISSPLWGWLERCLAKLPEDRFSSVQQALEQLPAAATEDF